MNKTNKILSARGIAEIAIMTAIAFGLDFLQGGLWRGVFTNGGSIGIAMLPILVLAYRKGFIPALISGFILAFLQMLGGIYSIASDWWKVLIQIGCDYIFAYPAVALAGVFFKKFQNEESSKGKAKWAVIGCVVGGFAKFIFHFISGVAFFPNSSFTGGPVVYSLVYNGGYMLPNIVICAIVLAIIVIKAPQIFVDKNVEAASTEGEVVHE